MGEKKITFDPKELAVGTAFAYMDMGLLVAKDDEKTIRIFQLLDELPQGFFSHLKEVIKEKVVGLFKLFKKLF